MPTAKSFSAQAWAIWRPSPKGKGPQFWLGSSPYWGKVIDGPRLFRSETVAGAIVAEMHRLGDTTAKPVLLQIAEADGR